MKMIYIPFYLITLILLTLNCSENKSQTKEKRIEKVMLTYLINCTGGSLEACKTSCGNSCSVPSGGSVTTATLPCVSSCQTTCSSNCDLTTNLGLIISQN